MNTIKMALTSSTKRSEKNWDKTREQTEPALVAFVTSGQKTDRAYSTAPWTQDNSNNFLSRQLLFAL